MFRFSNLLYLSICLAFLQSCNTLYNTGTLKLEIMVPGKVKIPFEYRKAVIRYNNCNVSLNPNFSYFMENGKKITDNINTDSISSEIYFQVFAETLKNQKFFDSVIEIEPFNYSDTELNDTLIYLNINNEIGFDSINLSRLNTEVLHFATMVNRFSSPDSDKPKTKLIDPKLGLYSKDEIRQIADSTKADMFLSFDWFASVDGVLSPDSQDSINIIDAAYYNFRQATEVVYVIACWNIYDLKKQELTYSYRKTDTIKWIEPSYTLKEAKRILPPRKDAVFNAADIAGSHFAEFLVPHWIEVERMYYQSGQAELKKTEKLIKENRWLEAAEIWKKNVYNKNKSIAAKSMYNMALACEMNGDMDAAIDWAVKSFYVFGNENPAHAHNTSEYIRILGQRKLDIKKIESEPDLKNNSNQY
jgi:hypothetical protein